MARMGRFMVGPFKTWVLRERYASFIVTEKARGKLSALGSINDLSVPLTSIERAYVDVSGDLWLLIHSTAYDLVKHFRGSPKLWRRLPSLWAMRCVSCGIYSPTSLKSGGVCGSCEGRLTPVIFWRDAFSREVSVGPCRIYNGMLTDGGRGYYLGEILGLSRDMLGNLYAVVLSFTGRSTSDMRLVDVDELPEIGWRRPLVMAGEG
ncbi:MAG: hypothetical protein QXD32_02330 [Nitrososphaerota archaeon]